MKRRVLIKKQKQKDFFVYSYISFEKDDLIIKSYLEFDIEDIKTEILALKPFVKKFNQLKKELEDCQKLLKLMQEKEEKNDKI